MHIMQTRTNYVRIYEPFVRFFLMNWIYLPCSIATKNKLEKWEFWSQSWKWPVIERKRDRHIYCLNRAKKICSNLRKNHKKGSQNQTYSILAYIIYAMWSVLSFQFYYILIHVRYIGLINSYWEAYNCFKSIYRIFHIFNYRIDIHDSGINYWKNLCKINQIFIINTFIETEKNIIWSDLKRFIHASLVLSRNNCTEYKQGSIRPSSKL